MTKMRKTETKSALWEQIEAQMKAAAEARLASAAERARAKTLREQDLSRKGVPLNQVAWES
jgi:hypothetical protein